MLPGNQPTSQAASQTIEYGNSTICERNLHTKNNLMCLVIRVDIFTRTTTTTTTTAITTSTTPRNVEKVIEKLLV